MHRSLREVLRAGYVQPTDATEVADQRFAVKHIPFLEPETAGFDLLNTEGGRTVRNETFARVRGNMKSGAHLPLYRAPKYVVFQQDIGSRSPKEFSSAQMDRFHNWIETQKKMLLVQLGAWPEQIATYNRLSLCKVEKVPMGEAFSPYEIDEPVPMLTRGDLGAWDQWPKGHDRAMAVWFKVWKILVSGAPVTHALVFDTA